MKYYEVKAKCGHVGRKYYVLKTFAVKAEDGKEAARIVRNIPRVKHHHKDAIREVNEIDILKYWEIIENNKKDPYFFCHSVQDRRSYIEEDIYNEERYFTEVKEESNLKRVFNGKIMMRKPKQYIRNYCLEEGWAY